jgi:hypothetical protein
VLVSGLVVAVVMAAGHPVRAIASRPATAVGLRRAALVVVRHDEIGAGRYVSGGGRGGRVARPASRHRPGPTTRRAHQDRRTLLAVQAAVQRRRVSDPRTTPPAVPSARMGGLRIVAARHDRRRPLAGAHAYHAHAPPRPATPDVAGLPS